MTLHGPAHADAFRVKVGRYNDRWYHDPLPACPLAPATEEAWPSVSIVKNAAAKDWSFIAATRVADFAYDFRAQWQDLPREAAIPLLAGANDRGLKAAQDRGTRIHTVMEELGQGRTQFLDLNTAAQPYLAACRLFLEDHQPEWVLSEAVSINRTIGYGGTFDAVLRIADKAYLVDYKTRKSDGHGAYPEEGWQLSAYAKAEYLIVEAEGHAQRITVPPLDGALVISLTPEGYRLYPVDLEQAWESFQALKTLWTAKTNKVIGKPVVLAVQTRLAVEPPLLATEAPQPETIAIPTAAPGDPEQRAWLLRRLRDDAEQLGEKRPEVARYWPEGVPPLIGDHPHTGVELGLIAAGLNRLERDYSLPFGEQRPGDPAMERALVPLGDNVLARIAVCFAADNADQATVLVAQLADGTARLVTDDEGVTTLETSAQPQPQETLL